MGANDTGEQLAAAIDECIRLENELKAEKATVLRLTDAIALCLIALNKTTGERDAAKLMLAEDTVYMNQVEGERDKALAERDASREVNAEFLAARGAVVADHEVCTTELAAALAAIERVLNLTGDIGPEARRILTQLPSDALDDHDVALIATHTEMIMDTTRAAAVQAIADAEMRGYQRQMGERISEALAAQNRHYTASPMNEGVGE